MVSFFSVSLLSKSERPALMSSCSTAAAENSLKGSRLNFRVPVKSVGSYAMTVIFDLSYYMSICEISTPSMRI